MARKFNDLRDKMSPQRQAKSTLMAQEMMAEMLLAEIRKQIGLSQEALAQRLGITPPALSELESQDDLTLSMLHQIVEALGGELEVIVRLPGHNSITLGHLRGGSGASVGGSLPG